MMPRISVRTHEKAKRASPRGSRVITKRVHTKDGDTVVVRAIDSNSATFGNDLLTVFRQNVRKARKENRERFGVSDGAPEPA